MSSYTLYSIPCAWLNRTDPFARVKRSNLNLKHSVEGILLATWRAYRCLDPVDGIMTSELWNMDTIRRYLKEEVSLLTPLMLIMCLRGGQAPRTTGFFSVEYQNGASTSRRVYVRECSTVYVTQHSKERSFYRDN